jgi:hypothetical protein
MYLIFPTDESVSKAKEMVLKFMKENVIKAGLDFDDDILRDPRSLEQAIKSLSIHKQGIELVTGCALFISYNPKYFYR